MAAQSLQSTYVMCPACGANVPVMVHLISDLAPDALLGGSLVTLYLGTTATDLALHVKEEHDARLEIR